MKSLIVVAVLLNLSGISWGKADVERRPSSTFSDWSTYHRYGIQRAHYDSPRLFPGYSLPTQPKHKMTIEMTTPRPNKPSTKPEKLKSLSSSFQTNLQILQAIQLSPNKFRIRQVYPIETQMLQGIAPPATNGNGFATATSLTSADSPMNIPDFNFHSSESSLNGATLVLEPSSKAVSGNGGTAISSPISRAILRKNMGTRVIYRPESVAIAGVGGTAHAQSDLILDYVE